MTRLSDAPWNTSVVRARGGYRQAIDSTFAAVRSAGGADRQAHAVARCAADALSHGFYQDVCIEVFAQAGAVRVDVWRAVHDIDEYNGQPRVRLVGVGQFRVGPRGAITDLNDEMGGAP